MASCLLEVEAEGEEVLVGRLIQALGVNQSFVQVKQQNFFVSVFEITLQFNFFDC